MHTMWRVFYILTNHTGPTNRKRTILRRRTREIGKEAHVHYSYLIGKLSQVQLAIIRSCHCNSHTPQLCYMFRIVDVEIGRQY